MLLVHIEKLHEMIHVSDKARKEMMQWMHFIVIILSLALIVYISYDTFAGISFLDNDTYMNFQLWVCVVMASVVYFSSLIFFYQEHTINPLVPDFWSALWWSCMNATTVGSDINPMTPLGKILGGLLGILGMIVFPLFTVYITNIVQRYNSRRLLAIGIEEQARKNAAATAATANAQ